MAWKLSLHNMKDRHALSVTDINDNFTTVIDEVGFLNEHNWTRRSFYRVGGFNVVRDVKPDAAFVINQTSVEKNPNEDLENDLNLMNLDPSGKGFKIPATAGWEHVPTQSGTQGDTMTITTKGGLLWIMASFQHSSGTAWWGVPLSRQPTATTPAGYETALLAVSPYSVGAEYALQLDGSIIPESILGSGENTVQDKAELRSTKLTISGVEYTVGRVKGSTPGCYGERLPCVVEAVIPVPPGVHTIRLMARVPNADAGEESPQIFEAAKATGGGLITDTIFTPLNWCTNRELIVFELTR